MRILEKKKVSFGIRLKELMQEHNPPLTQEGLAGLLRNPAYEDNPPFNPHTISTWVQDKGSLRRNRREILQQLSDIFDVDPEYLECTQVEKRKVKPSFPSDNKLADTLKKLEGFIEYLESIGIKYNYTTSTGHIEVFQYIDSGYLYTVEDTVGDEGEVQFSIEGKTITLSEKECDAKICELEKYTKYLLFN